MKRVRDLRTSISVILVLSAITAMMGCAVSRSEEYRDPLANIHIQSASPAYPNIVLAVLISENTKKTIEDGRHGRSWKTAEELEKMLDQDIDVYRKNFKAVIRIDKFEDVSAVNANLVAVLDWVAGIGDSAKSEKRAIFLTPDKQPIDTIKGQGIQPVGTFAGPGSFKKATEQADATARGQLALALGSSLKLAEFSKSITGISSTATVRDQKEMPVHASEKPATKSDVDELPAIKVKHNKHAYAIVIGIENYRQKLPKADYAVADAKIISEYLMKTMGYPEENVITLLNDRALKSDMEKYFDRWLINNVEENGRVFIYYSGHGAPNTKTGDAYLVPYDGDPTFIAETGYPIARLYESLGKLKAKEIIVVLDSCFSGGGGRSVLAKGAKPLVMTINTPNIKKNIAVMTASSRDQISSAYEEQGHGLFTYFMLKGIKREEGCFSD